jgi:hypothetical protein
VTDEKTFTPIELGAPTVESGRAPRARKNYGSKYAEYLEKAKSLGAGEGFVRVPLGEETNKDRAIGALRTVIKRRLPDDYKALKVGTCDDGDLFIERV